MTELTRILAEARSGDEVAGERLAAALYEELRRLARGSMRGERVDHTLQPTALVHEAWIRLVDEQDRLESRAHFFAAAAAAIRRILIEHARRRARLKRGGAVAREDAEVEAIAAPDRDDRMLAVDEALRDLAVVDPEKARLVELRFFAGLTVEEIAEVRRVSPSTVARDWRVVRAWLESRLGDDGRRDLDRADPVEEARPHEDRTDGRS